ncbi:MAG: hypothetical protein QOJ20_4409 [Mycobacterium sp.]|nr:hypothetical protein [Mycobacterium sp.]
MSEMKYLDLHGDRVAYQEAGAGEALLLIHGMADRGAASVDLSSPVRCRSRQLPV